jgi:ornithine--oxo-acid transaminase
MAPIAIDETKNVPNGTLLKATARSFRPAGGLDASRYHAPSSKGAIAAEAAYAAHNYHPLPVVFARASGCSVWDPVRNPQPKR